MITNMISNIKDSSKRFIRKQAIEQVKENITYQQKNVSDYTKEELRGFILKEEKRIIRGAGLKSVLVVTDIKRNNIYLMVKFFVKQFLYGRVYLWLKPKIYGLLFLLLAISSIYLHDEYLRYLEINDDNYLVGLSFVIKNILIICLVIGYLIFQYFLNKSKDKIEKLEREIIDNQNCVSSLDQFLEPEELNRE